MNKKIFSILTLLIITISVAVSYAYMRSTLNNNQNMQASIKTGTIHLTFTDGNPSITGSLNMGESTNPKELVLENTGSLPSAATIEFKNLTNTYIRGSLTYTLKRKTTETGSYTEVFTKDMPVGVYDALPIYSESDMPSGAKYYYQIIVTFNELINCDQTSDVDATFITGFTVIDGVDTIATNGFTNDSWETVIKNVKAGFSNIYSVGDTKCIALDGYTTTNNNGCSNGEFLVRVANNSTPNECNNKGFSQTACGFVIEFVDIISTYAMNPPGMHQGINCRYGWNTDGYPASAMHEYIVSDLITKFPTNIRNAMLDTQTVSGRGTPNRNNFTTIEKLYLISPPEIWGIDESGQALYYDSSYNDSRQLDYYYSLGVTDTNFNDAIKLLNQVETAWWTRSASIYGDIYFNGVDAAGEWAVYDAIPLNGVSPAFRL